MEKFQNIDLRLVQTTWLLAEHGQSSFEIQLKTPTVAEAVSRLLQEMVLLLLNYQIAISIELNRAHEGAEKN